MYTITEIYKHENSLEYYINGENKIVNDIYCVLKDVKSDEKLLLDVDHWPRVEDLFRFKKLVLVEHPNIDDILKLINNGNLHKLSLSKNIRNEVVRINFENVIIHHTIYELYDLMQNNIINRINTAIRTDDLLDIEYCNKIIFILSSCKIINIDLYGNRCHIDEFIKLIEFIDKPIKKNLVMLWRMCEFT